MKKIISFITAFILTFSACPAVARSAESDDPELYSVAYSLGADTEYMNVLNFAQDEEHQITMETYNRYIYNCSVIEAAYVPALTFSSVIQSGACVGISILEVLAHNGIISPSDIQQGAEKMTDISYSEEIAGIIMNYQAIQGYTEFDNYEKYLLSSLSYDEQVSRLIETAQKCMKENRYFLITVRADNLSHAFCGIGITEGAWTFNDIEYDKCILTLDSNIKGSDGNPKGFSNKSCIYINSQTNQTYIPSYDTGTEHEIIFAAIDDDELLNYKGIIKPSESVSDEVTRVKHISCHSGNEEIYAISENSEKLPLNEAIFIDSGGHVYLDTADRYCLEMNNDKGNFANWIELRYIDTDRWIDVELQPDDTLKNGYNGIIDVSRNCINVLNKNDEPLEISSQIRMNEGTYNFSPYYAWSFNSYVSDDITIQVRDEGILLESNGRIKTNVFPQGYTLDENGHFKFFKLSLDPMYIDPEKRSIFLDTDSNVLLKLDDNKFRYFIDDNNDDVYDTEIQKGDIDCSGNIDSADASEILNIYSNLSILPDGKTSSIDYSLADFNSDDKIDAIDASSVLAEYAKSATK